MAENEGVKSIVLYAFEGQSTSVESHNAGTRHDETAAIPRAGITIIQANDIAGSALASTCDKWRTHETKERTDGDAGLFRLSYHDAEWIMKLRI